MSDWNSLSLHFDPFGPLKPPIKSVLTVLQTVEAVLESLLAIIKAFSLDLLNPLKAAVALMLAAIRSIINHVKSSGFSVLLIHPDFSQSDFGAVLNSVSGSYPKFESKVVAKFHDTSDIFRPTYPNGSSVAMFVFYIGAETPGDLITQIFALLNFIKHPQTLSGLPAPVNLKVRPVNQSGAAISRFKKLFDSSLDKSLQLEWQMPMAPSGGKAPGFVNSLVSFYNSFRFPNFIIERSSKPQGEVVTQELKSQTVGKTIMGLQGRFDFAKPETQVTVREPSGAPLKHFEKKTPISSESGLLEGQLTGTYRFLDTNFGDDDRGKNFYYRVRAYFGSPNSYLKAASVGDYKGQSKTDGNKIVYSFGDNNIVGNPSPVVRGFVPRKSSSSTIFNLYNDIFRAIQAGILLNFEFPPASAGDSAQRRKQKTGWGTLSVIGGQIGPLKSSYKTSDKLKDAFLFKTASRRIANQCSVSLYSNPALADLVATKWSDGAHEAVDLVESTKKSWSFIGIKSGITDRANSKINSYLDKESNYNAGLEVLPGPMPITALTPDNPDPTGVGEEQRQRLADFLRIALISLSGQSKHLTWYSVTIGDLFPSFIPFIFDFEQFILAMLKAVQSALQELESIVQTLISKIKQLENILSTIIALLDLLNIKVSVSILAATNSNGSANSLAQTLLNSGNKPGSSPSGLHSGMVLTAGGPGEGSIAALKAMAFLLQIPL